MRQNILKEISDSLERQHEEFKQIIYGVRDIRRIEDPDWDDPLFRAMNLPYNPETGEWTIRESDGV